MLSIPEINLKRSYLTYIPKYGDSTSEIVYLLQFAFVK